MAAQIQTTNASIPSTVEITATNERGEQVPVQISGEHPLTLYFDKKELLTIMTLGAQPEALALGWLRNQRLVSDPSEIAAIHVDWETESVAVTSAVLKNTGNTIWDTTEKAQKLEKKTTTSGCGQGTVFGDLMEDLDKVQLSNAYNLSQDVLYGVMDHVRKHESIYKQAGAVHGCALCSNSGENRGEILLFVEDVGRHNAVDAIAGQMWLHGMTGEDKIFYTTGRLTSEMVIKCAQMGIPVLVSRSGLTQMGYEIAQKLNITMLGPLPRQTLFAVHGRASIQHINQHTIRMSISLDDITGVILAGGMGRRMGGIDKGLRNYKNAPLALHAMMRLNGQVGSMTMNANRNIGVYEGFGIPVICDQQPDFAGPLAGMQTALSYATVPFLVTVPCDVPMFPLNLVEKLSAPFEKNVGLMLTVASTKGRHHPVFCMMRTELLPSMEEFLRKGGRKIDAWYENIPHEAVEFEDESAFHNVNTLDELKELEQKSSTVK